jgi:hypothetical protein
MHRAAAAEGETTALLSKTKGVTPCFVEVTALFQQSLTDIGNIW